MQQAHPDYIKYQNELKAEIEALKKERNAVILAHNYQRDEIQEVADICGDSLGLSRRAATTDADVIVFCGVHFMAESAAILSPGKTVLLPVEEAGCPMADMIDPPRLREMKDAHPDAAVVTYVNSSAEIKAESDICCTSANAVNVVRSLDAEKIIFTPDSWTELKNCSCAFLKGRVTRCKRWKICAVFTNRKRNGKKRSMRGRSLKRWAVIHSHCRSHTITAN